MEFMKISRSMHTQEHLDCSWQDPPNCVSIATSELKRHLHHDTTYCVILKFEGTNSIPTYVTASFLYLSSKFVRGAVVEYDRMDTNSVCIQLISTKEFIWYHKSFSIITYECDTLCD